MITQIIIRSDHLLEPEYRFGSYQWFNINMLLPKDDILRDLLCGEYDVWKIFGIYIQMHHSINRHTRLLDTLHRLTNMNRQILVPEVSSI